MRKQFFLMTLCVLINFGLLQADLTIDGGGGSLELSPTGTIGAGTGAKLTLRNVTIDSLSGNASTGRLIMHHSTSQLVLQNSTLSLDGNYSFTQGSLVVKGDCTITGTLGTLFTFNGHNILIDDNSTLRIKNVTFQAASTSRMRHLVRYGNATSKLVLDDAAFKVNNAPSALLSSGGMIMVGGNLVIEGSSVIDNTGTSSMHALFLGNGAYPSSDCRLVVRPRSKLTVRNAGIVFKNVGIGSLDLSGGEGALAVETNANFLIESLVNLGNGTFNFDFSTLLGLEKNIFYALDSSTTDSGHGNTVYSVSWSPDGQYLALSGDNGTLNYEVRVHGFDGNTFTYLPDSNLDYNITETVSSVSWHPSGLYLAYGGDRVQFGSYFYTTSVHSFDGSSLTTITGLDFGKDVASVAWSPDGRYLAVGGFRTADNVTHQVYSFDGSVTTTLTGCRMDHGEVTVGITTVYSVAWSPDGKYLAVGGKRAIGNITHRVYRFDGESLTELPGCRGDHGNHIYGVSWSPDGRYLAIGGERYGLLLTHRVYSFDGNSLTLLDSKDYGTDSVDAVSWSPDGRWLAVAGERNDSIDATYTTSRVYSFDGSVMIELIGCRKDHGNHIRSVSWYPDGRFLAGGGRENGGLMTIRVYPSVYSSSQALAEFQTGILNLKGRTFNPDNLILKVY